MDHMFTKFLIAVVVIVALGLGTLVYVTNELLGTATTIVRQYR